MGHILFGHVVNAVITWTRRNEFIEYAAGLMAAGDPVEVAFYSLGEYAEPYKKGEAPTIGPKQLVFIMPKIRARAQQIKCRGCTCDGGRVLHEPGQ